MLFNSFSFLVFFPLVVIMYFALPQKFRWMLLLAASYYFYLSFKLEYFFLIAISTIVSFYTAIWMGKTEDEVLRKRYLMLNMLANLGILFVFKYFNFALDSVNLALDAFNISHQFPMLRLLLPIGISFYTFQIIGYSLDVYYERVEPQKHLGIYALYVSFFPQLVAGPIERGGRLLPQFFEKHSFDYKRVREGLIIMIWGYFKKVVIADRIAGVVDAVYAEPGQFEGMGLIIATLLFAIQIYCDFSGYTDIAIGAAKVMGYDLMINFRRPFISQNISEFWRRWHISLSSWAKDYIYDPIAFKRKRWKIWGVVYAVFITFTLLGLWHGAKWAFIFFGLLQGLAFYYEMASGKIRRWVASKIPQAIYRNFSIMLTFLFFAFTGIFFRANNIMDGFYIAGHLDNGLIDFFYNFFKKFFLELDFAPLVDVLKGINMQSFDFWILIIAIISMFQFERFGTDGRFWEPLEKQQPWFRWMVYMYLLSYIVLFGQFNIKEFIYFQF